MIDTSEIRRTWALRIIRAMGELTDGKRLTWVKAFNPWNNRPQVFLAKTPSGDLVIEFIESAAASKLVIGGLDITQNSGEDQEMVSALLDLSKKISINAPQPQVPAFTAVFLQSIYIYLLMP